MKNAFQVLVPCLLCFGAAGCRATAPQSSAWSTSEARSETSPRVANSAWRQSSRPRERISPRTIEIPRFARGDMPAYPEESVRRHEQGAVDLRFRLLENGSLQDLEVERTSGYGRLDTAALAAARTWRFNPTTGSSDVEVVRYRLQFRLVDD